MIEPVVNLMAKIVSGPEALDGQFGLEVTCIGDGMATAAIVERDRN